MLAEIDRGGFELQQVGLTVTSDEGEPLQVLDEIDCRISAGRLTALIGPSGGGKTSLLRLMNRLDIPDTGSISYGGQNLSETDTRNLRRRIGFVPQQPYMFDGTARDNLLRGLAYFPRSSQSLSTRRIEETCDLCQFPQELLGRIAERLSIGQQQRLALGRALMLDPEVLLLDEPSSALDRPTAEQLGRALRQFCAAGKSIVLVSHDLAWVKAHADEVLFMVSGQLIVQKPAHEFFLNPGNDLAARFLSGEMAEERES